MTLLSVAPPTAIAVRPALKDAAMFAGLRVLRLIRKTVAAAMAYALADPTDKRVVVCHYGTEALDVSVADVSPGDCRTVWADGESGVGTEDLDLCLVSWLCEQFWAEHGTDLSRRPAALP